MYNFAITCMHFVPKELVFLLLTFRLLREQIQLKIVNEAC
jgi:hypothetical protein